MNGDLAEMIRHQQLTQPDSIRPIGRYALTLFVQALQYLHGREQQPFAALVIGQGVHALEDVVERVIHGETQVVLLYVVLALGVKIGWLAMSYLCQ